MDGSDASGGSSSSPECQRESTPDAPAAEARREPHRPHMNHPHIPPLKLAAAGLIPSSLPPSPSYPALLPRVSSFPPGPALSRPLLTQDPAPPLACRETPTAPRRWTASMAGLTVLLAGLCLYFGVMLGLDTSRRIIRGNPFAGTIVVELYKHVPLASFALRGHGPQTTGRRIAQSMMLNQRLIAKLGGMYNPAPLGPHLSFSVDVGGAGDAGGGGPLPQRNYGQTRDTQVGLVGVVPADSLGEDVIEVEHLSLEGSDFSLLHTMGKLLHDQHQLYRAGFTDGVLNHEAKDERRPPHGVVPLEDYENVTYSGNIRLGPVGEQQDFSVVFDTGSSNLWIPAQTCDSYACLSHQRFKPTSRTTSLNKPLKMSYGSGTAEGALVNDELEVGGWRIPAVNFGLMTNLDALGDSYKLGPFDGVFGLGWPSLAVGNIIPPLNIMLEEGILSRPMFSFAMKPGCQSGPGGTLVLGGWREEDILPGEELEWVPLAKESFWQAQVDRILLGDGEDRNIDAISHSFILDSGTSLITAPSPDVAQIAAKMNAFTLPDQPDVLLIHREDYDRGTMDLDFEVTTQDGDLLTITLRKADWIKCPLAPPAPCILSLQALDIPEPNGPLWILGDIFLARYAIAFDIGGRRIGIAKSQYWADHEAEGCLHEADPAQGGMGEGPGNSMVSA